MLLCLFFIDRKSIKLKSVVYRVPKHFIAVANDSINGFCIRILACFSGIAINLNMVSIEQLRALKCLLQLSNC